MLKNNAFITDLHLVVTVRWEETSIYWEWLTRDMDIMCKGYIEKE